MFTLLIIDADKSIRLSLSQLFQRDGYIIHCAKDGVEALALLGMRVFDAVITEYVLLKMTGDEFLRRVKQLYPRLPVIFLTAHGTVPIAVSIMSSGAYHFFMKPIDGEDVCRVMRQVMETRRLTLEQFELKMAHSKFDHPAVMPQLLRQSPAMMRLQQLIELAAPTRSNVLILGESGVGKELVAQALHAFSPRARKTMIKVNCAALSDDLLESELFGHERGAFTDAKVSRRGRFELAEGSDLFLDEIGDISPKMQVKLLRVLQERTFERLGSERSLQVNVRIIAATNKNLWQQVEKGLFREDLYYRLNVIAITVPPLRERSEDVIPLAKDFLKEFNAQMVKTVQGLSTEALRALEAYPWPGNVRQLRNCIESAVALCTSKVIQVEHLPLNPQNSATHSGFSINGDVSLMMLECQYIEFVVKRVGGNKSAAAKNLGISRKTLQRKLDLGAEANHDNK